MAKVLFALLDMRAGGTENVLLRFLEALNKYGHDITLLLADNKGEWIKRIPNNIKIQMIPLSEEQRQNVTNLAIGDSIKAKIKKGKLLSAGKIFVKKTLGNNLAALQGKFADFQNLDGEFDVAVSYQFHNTFITRYVAEKINAKKKFVWVHNDLTTTNYNYKYAYKYISHFDKIFCVSAVLLNEMAKAFPQVRERIEIFYNCIDKDKILEKANEPQKELDENHLNILSVGRLNRQKGFDLAIRVADCLRKSGYVFRWYIIGEGEEHHHLEMLIKKHALENYVVLMGQVENPYKYMKACDIYVQPSRHEGFCTTTNEAKIFYKPIIATKVAGMDEQFVNEKNALLVDIDVKAIYGAIIRLLDNMDFAEELAKRLEVKEDTEEQITKYFSL